MKKPKFFLIPPLILALCVILCAIVLAAASDTPEIVASGECGADGDNVTWTLNSEGTLTIIGTGKIADYKSSSSKPWYANSSKINNVTIKSGVTHIGAYSFSHLGNLVSVNIPDSVTTFGESAFEYCVHLTNVTIPGGVKATGREAFSYCKGLTKVTLPDGLVTISPSTFSHCESLSDIAIPPSVRRIGYYAFSSCKSINQIIFSDELQVIGKAAFSNCTGLGSVYIPVSVTTIGNESNTFWGSSNPVGAGNPFSGCTSLTSINVSDGNPNYYAVDGTLFLRNEPELVCYPMGKTATSYTIPNGIEKIGNHAFSGCLNLTNVSIPDSVTFIGESAFLLCKNIGDIKIPNSVTFIGESAFSGCASLAKITIPDSVTSIRSFAFRDCDSLSDILLSANLKAIRYGVFMGCTSLPKIEIPDGITSIAQSAFSGCSELKEVTIPNSVKTIGSAAFEDCTNLAEVKLPDSLETLDGFNGCTKLTSIEIPNNVTSVGGFNGCTALADITIPVSVTSIQRMAFASCGSLKNVYYAGSETQWREISVGERNEGIQLWADIYYDGNHETPGRDTSKIPKIALTYAPAYGDGHNFQGVVYTEDGSEFDTSAYRVTLYVQYEYPKPTWANPSVPINNGSFSLSYTSGGDTTRTFLDLMLIPADFDQKNASYEQTRSAAIDYVEVYRTKEGEVTILPERQPPESNNIAPAIPSGLLPVKQDKIVVDVGFYTNGSSPGSALSADLIRQQLDAVSKFSDTVRFYGSAGELAKAYEIAHNMGFAVLGNAWLSKDKAANQTELDALIEHCNNGYCKIAIVGSEVLLRGDLSAGELIEAIEYVRERLTDKTIPVTTADSVDLLISMPSVRNACNLLMPNCYPYWGGSSIEQAAGHFIENMEALDAVRGEKEILVSETGWPTAGQGKDNAKAGETEAAQYYSAIREWSLSSNTQVLFFDATDEPWKTKDEGESGAHWGFMTTDFVLKDCYKNLNPFQEQYAIEYVSGNATSTTASLTNNTGAVAEICYAVAAYNTNGRMISCNMVSKSMGVSESVSLAVSYSESDAVTQIKAFVLDANTFAPLQGAWAKNSE